MVWLFSILLMTPMSHGEYRVFKLKIQNSKTKKNRTFLSTMDATQYPEYHYLKLEETIVVEDTWMCWKRHRAWTPLCTRAVEDKDVKGLENF